MSMPYHLINESLGIKDSNFYLIPSGATVAAAPKRTTGINWYSPEVIRNGGFFYEITKEQFEQNKGRLTTPPPAKSAQYGVRYRTEKRTFTEGRTVKYGHYYFCETI